MFTMRTETWLCIKETRELKILYTEYTVLNIYRISWVINNIFYNSIDVIMRFHITTFVNNDNVTKNTSYLLCRL